MFIFFQNPLPRWRLRRGSFDWRNGERVPTNHQPLLRLFAKRKVFETQKVEGESGQSSDRRISRRNFRKNREKSSRHRRRWHRVRKIYSGKNSSEKIFSWKFLPVKVTLTTKQILLFRLEETGGLVVNAEYTFVGSSPHFFIHHLVGLEHRIKTVENSYLALLHVL